MFYPSASVSQPKLNRDFDCIGRDTSSPRISSSGHLNFGLDASTAPIFFVGEASYQLAELGRTPGVMSHEVHRVFASARSELESLMGTHQTTNSEGRKQFDHKHADLESRWKDKVIAACRKMLDENVS